MRHQPPAEELLRSAGIELEVRDLLREAWTPERLRPFFGRLPVAEWFNPSAPAIKYGELDVSELSAEQALELMVAQPLLIRRPLIRCGMHYMVDFDTVGINAAAVQRPAASAGTEHQRLFAGHQLGARLQPRREHAAMSRAALCGGRSQRQPGWLAQIIRAQREGRSCLPQHLGSTRRSTPSS